MTVRVLAALLVLSSPALAEEDDWPQFRGPGGLGVSTATGMPVEWGKDKGIRWTADLPGVGLSSPVVAGGRLYLTACSGPEQERLHVLCFDAKSGARLWERRFRATGPTQCNNKTNMAAPTPAADGGRVFALFATCDLAALDRDGRLLWYRSLAGDYPTIGNNVGMAASPVLHGDTLLIAMENVGESFAAALDARSGRNVWKQARSAKINWTTPFVWTRDGRAEALFQSAEELTAYDVASGSRLWSHAGAKLSTIPSPVASAGQVFAPGGPFVALSPGDGSAKKLWEAPLPAATASPTVYKGRLYTVDSAGIVSCADPKDGKVLWKVRTKGPYSASPLAVEDRLYLVNEAGSTAVVALGEEGKVVAVNDLGDPMLASPAASGGALYLRSDRKLYCVGAP
jgi:outer membrane protein assembly factor BamB